MKKKFLALLGAATMVMGSVLSVSAAGSISADAVLSEVQNQTVGDTKITANESAGTVTVTVNNEAAAKVEIPATPEKLEASADQAKAMVNAGSVELVVKPVENSKAVAEVASEIATLLNNVETGTKTVSDVKMAFFADIKPAGEEKTVTFTAELTTQWNQAAYAMHYDESTGKVEKIDGVWVSGGKWSFTLTSFSPVAVVVVTSDDKADDAAEDDTPVVTQPDAVGPKTADFFGAAFLLTAACGTASAAFAKKAKRD